MEINLKDLTTFQLEELKKECIEKISKMTADIETVILCTEIDQELRARK